MKKITRLSLMVLLCLGVVLSFLSCTKIVKYEDEFFVGEICYDTSKELNKVLTDIEEGKVVVKKIMDQEIPILELFREKNFSGNFSGGFLSGTSGKIKSFSTVILRWQAKDGRSYFLELPFDKVCFKNCSEKPTLNLLFNLDVNAGYHEPFKRPTNFTDFDNWLKKPTELIKSSNIFLATISISEKDIETYLSFR